MSYLWTRKIAAKPEHVFDAIGFAHKASGYVNTKHPGYDVKVYIQTMGDLNAIVWTANFGSVDEFHTMFATLMQDQEYAGMITGAGKFWVEGSGVDTLLMEMTLPG